MSQLFSLEDATAAQLVEQMNTQGHATLENFIPAPLLVELRRYVDQQADLHENRFFALHGYPQLEGSVMARLAQSESLRQLIEQLHDLGAGRAARSPEIFPVLRCVQGQTGRQHSWSFHYDATLLTLLIPIYIPRDGAGSGELVLFPNLRKVRRIVLVNVIEKALLQNSLCRRLLAMAVERGWVTPTALPIVPGNLYLFWGYRSLHANRPCDPAVRRATAMLHYGDPHAGSLATRLILRLNQHRARRALARPESPAA